jgi:hypothetical protein
MPSDLFMTLAAIIGAVTVLFGTGYSVFKIAKRIDAALGVDEKGRTISDRLDKVEHQLWENGGSSLADRVNNIEHHIIKVSTEIDFIKDLTLGIHNSSIPNSVPTGLLKATEKPLVKKRVVKPKKAS